MFRGPDARSILIPLIIVIAVKLIAKPLLAWFISVNYSLPGIWERILVFLSAMPPAVLGVVFLKRYGGDARLASALLPATSLISCDTIIVVFRVFM